jgi:hypothetical protein
MEPDMRPTRLLTPLAIAALVALVASGLAGGPVPSGAASPAPHVTIPGAWSLTPTPNEFAGGQISLNLLAGVSCAGGSFCVAVGFGGTLGGPPIAPIATTWNGSAWGPMLSPAGSGSGELNAVSCVTADWCMAVGNDGVASAVAQVFNGTSWTNTALPSVAGASTALSGVTCSSTTSCTAVGASEVGMSSEPWIVQWNGTTWVPQTVPTGVGTDASLDSVSCLGLTCQAVGENSNGVLALSGSGSDWSVTPNPVLGSDSVLTGVSCANATSCMAVGSKEATQQPSEPLAEYFDGTSWTEMTVPSVPDSTGGAFNGVDCVGPTSCVVVGDNISTVQSNVDLDNLVEAWNGSTWAIQSTPSVTFSSLQAISCVAAASCMAVGQAGELAGTSLAMTAPFANAGYDEVAADGGIFDFGGAFYGSMGGQHLNQPIVGLARTPDGGGYWEVAADGGIFNFGDAGFYGSMGGQHLNAPIVSIASTPDGRGYWEVAADGGIFNFGDAPLLGSMGGQHLNAPVVGIAAAPTGGYYEVASDGGIFNFGAPFLGSMGAAHLNKPVVGITSGPTGGYYEVASDGGIFNFGAPFLGSMGGSPLNQPVVAVTS